MDKTNTSTPEDEILLDLNADWVIKPVGTLNATITRPAYNPQGNMTWKYLKSRKTLDMPEGSAILVKSRNGFTLAQFFEPGTITGPLVFAKTDIEDPKTAFRRSTDFKFDIFGSLAGLLIIAASAVFSVFFDPSPDHTAFDNAALIALMVIASFMFTRSIVKAVRAGYYDDASAIHKMKQSEADLYENGHKVKPPELTI
ncbi:hypothetical protein [Sulfitobacter sp. R18_1]|uniref:hypothetical protein n=1 Tax=Sulfitobacter sp. R18_1 TaxID=2821104 RepID=UPI001ADD5ABE|nr:hypothetical protein [Sulfitobacter sp. R18_1]MBO9428150.1 hypothetical protein [Sulfitobacter sp. R18_1]